MNYREEYYSQLAFLVDLDEEIQKIHLEIIEKIRESDKEVVSDLDAKEIIQKLQDRKERE